MTEQERKDALRYLDAPFLVDLVMCADDQAGDGVNYSRRHKKDDEMYQEVPSFPLTVRRYPSAVAPATNPAKRLYLFCVCLSMSLLLYLIIL